MTMPIRPCRMMPALSLGLFLVSAGCARSGAPEKISFPSGGRDITMAHWAPSTPGPHPAILLLHGGGGPQLIENDSNYRMYPEALAAAGYDVYMPYYWESTDPKERQTPASFTVWVGTARRAREWVSRQPNVQPGKVGAIGLSLGGYMVLALGATDPGLSAIVEFYGGLDEPYAAHLTRMPPTLILHGEKDALVKVSEARKLEKLFQAKGIPYEIHLYPEQNHGFTGADGQDSVRRMVSFLDRHVKSGAAR